MDMGPPHSGVTQMAVIMTTYHCHLHTLDPSMTYFHAMKELLITNNFLLFLLHFDKKIYAANGASYDMCKKYEHIHIINKTN